MIVDATNAITVVSTDAGHNTVIALIRINLSPKGNRRWCNVTTNGTYSCFSLKFRKLLTMLRFFFKTTE